MSLDPAVWQITIPLIGATIAWLANEWRKRSWEDFLRKEEYYKSLLTKSSSFLEGGPHEDREAFLSELRVAWLYCPDEVIRKAYAFLATLEVGAATTQDQKTNAIRELALAIRKDIQPWYRRSKLLASDFKLLRANSLRDGA